jgi:hypothetical protein
VTPGASFHFDRDAHFGYRDSLTYQIVVDWVIAEHKSQGLFQNRCRQDRFENFWIFRVGNDTPGDSSEIFYGFSRSRTTAQQNRVSATGEHK